MRPTDPQRPAILMLTRNLPPLIGGMERMMHETIKGLCEWADLSVIGPQGCADVLPDSVQAIEVPAGLATFLPQATWQAIKLCKSTQFDWVLGGSGLTGPSLALLQKTFKLKTAVFIHGLDIVAPNRVYQALFVPAIARANLILANSHNTARLARERHVDAARIQVIHPGCHPPDPDAPDRVPAFKHQHGLDDGPILLFVGRMTPRKGLSAFISKSLPAIFKQRPDIQLLLVGDEPSNALNKEGEKQAVMRSISGLPQAQQDRIHALGHVSEADINTCYAAAALHVFPILDLPGDVEGFGMVVIEAASYGTPTVAFSAGGVIDAIGTSGGAAVSPGNYQRLGQEIIKLTQEHHLGTSESRCRDHAAALSWTRFNTTLQAQLLEPGVCAE